MRTFVYLLFCVLLIVTTHPTLSQVIDSFDDNDLTTNPSWTGDSGSWQIVIDSDVAAGAANSFTLRLNGPSVDNQYLTQYLSTQRTESWGDEQSWSFWLGRRQRTAMEQNCNIVWLWASEPNLKSETVDGYRIKFGDNVEEAQVYLQKVVDGIATNIITSTSGVPQWLKDIGFLVRVTRAVDSRWSLYTSPLPTADGEGAVATAVPSKVNTPIFHGSVIDATFTNFANGYLGFMAIHGWSDDSRTAAEFDQLYFDTSSDASLPVELVSFTAKPQSNSVVLEWITESEVNNLGFEVLRTDHEDSDFILLASYRDTPSLFGRGSTSERQVYVYTDRQITQGKNLSYKLVQVDFSGAKVEYEPVVVTFTNTDKLGWPRIFCVYQNYPNPFNPTTVIPFDLPDNSDVKISIFDILGTAVYVVNLNDLRGGYHELLLNDMALPAGSYFYQIVAGENSDIKKMTMLK